MCCASQPGIAHAALWPSPTVGLLSPVEQRSRLAVFIISCSFHFWVSVGRGVRRLQNTLRQITVFILKYQHHGIILISNLYMNRTFFVRENTETPTKINFPTIKTMRRTPPRPSNQYTQHHRRHITALYPEARMMTISNNSRACGSMYKSGVENTLGYV